MENRQGVCPVCQSKAVFTHLGEGRASSLTFPVWECSECDQPVSIDLDATVPVPVPQAEPKQPELPRMPRAPMPAARSLPSARAMPELPRVSREQAPLYGCMQRVLFGLLFVLLSLGVLARLQALLAGLF